MCAILHNGGREEGGRERREGGKGEGGSILTIEVGIFIWGGLEGVCYSS